MRILLPKTYAAYREHREEPLFFFAGPVRGGGDWQAKMTAHFEATYPNCIIVNPSRYDESHPFHHCRMKGEENCFERQTDWERHYLEQAAHNWPRGCIVFWLGCEDAAHPRGDGQPYARDTYGEIGEWRGRMMNNPDWRVVMGAEEHFPGLSQIKRNFARALPDFKIHASMEEVAQEAWAVATKKLTTNAHPRTAAFW